MKVSKFGRSSINGRDDAPPMITLKRAISVDVRVSCVLLREFVFAVFTGVLLASWSCRRGGSED